MKFTTGKYRFLVAPYCQDAYFNAINILAQLKPPVSRKNFNALIAQIHVAVQQGDCPAGATPVEGRPGHFFKTVYSAAIMFSVNEAPPAQVQIESIDTAQLAAMLEDETRPKP